MEPDRWLGIELRHFLALEAVARTGSFGKAAISLGYTQSAVSQQIATLERIVGQRLVERPGGPKPVSLTEAGRLLLTHADAIAARVAAAQADLSALEDGQVGTLRVGVFQSVGQRILPDVMRRFLEAWPQVDVSLTESADDTELLALVERGELDLTFSDLPLVEGPFESVELMRDPYVLVVPADSPLLGRTSPPTYREIAEHDLIGHKHCRTLAKIEAGFGRPVRFVFRSDHNQTVQALVAAGVGLAWSMYLRSRVPVLAPVGSLLTRAARQDLYQDTVNEAVLMRPGQYLTRSLVFVDNRGVDGAVNGLAALIGGTSGRLRRLQTGFVRSYALSMFAGAAVVVGAMLLVRL